MKAEYAKPFLNAYKKSIGKLLADGKARMAKLRDSGNPEQSLLALANLGQELPFALVGQAYQAYMGDLRRGKYVGTPVETAIWAILVNRSDLIEPIDRAFSRYVGEKHAEKFPKLFADVFGGDE